jgi:acyl-CoA reductase-like NAD-dependent aldehyde dehydrogenase
MLQTSEGEDSSSLNSAYTCLRDSWVREGGLTLQQRRDALRALRESLVQNREAYAEALNIDFCGRSRHETLLTEVATLISATDYTIPRLKTWAKPQNLPLGLPHWPASAKLIKQPRGVAGIISPSNYPLLLALMPAIGALSAGCRVLIKPSELTPRTSALLHSTLAASVDPAMMSVVCGDAKVAAELTNLPLDILLFTGSQRSGQKVLVSAATRLIPTVLELGGKSPVIIDRGTNLAESARAIMAGKLVNAGQTCVAPDYVLVPREDYDLVLKHLVIAARALYPEPTKGDYTAILLDRSISRLAELEHGHSTLDLFTQKLAPPFYMPKLVLSPTLESPVMQEEVFGPLLSVIPYKKLDDAIGVVRSLPPPLVLYWFGQPNSRLETVVRSTASGALSINETVVHAGISALPFGGIGASGMGRYHGRAGFDTFTHERPVYRQARYSLTKLMRPPYGALAERILSQLLR